MGKSLVIRKFQYNFIPMTNAELVQYLADGYNATEISELTTLPTTTINKKIYTLKQMLDCKTIGHLIAKYFRKELIK